MSTIIGLFKRYFFIDIKWVLLTILVGLITFFIVRKKLSRRNHIVVPVLAAYAFLMLSYLVLSRHASGYHDYQLIPFWSYQWFIVSRKFIFMALVNVAIYVPLGFGLPTVTKSYRKAIGLGFIYSVLINMLQFITTTGAFELDDIFHNFVGVCIGCILCDYARKVYKKWLRSKKNKKAVTSK